MLRAASEQDGDALRLACVVAAQSLSSGRKEQQLPMHHAVAETLQVRCHAAYCTLLSTAAMQLAEGLQSESVSDELLNGAGGRAGPADADGRPGQRDAPRGQHCEAACSFGPDAADARQLHRPKWMT